MKIEDIKFKAKRLDNGEWIVGSLIRSNAGVKERTYIVDNFSSVSDYSVVGVNPSTVCQFTGLKDREGKEIWAHDLLQSQGAGIIGEVSYSEEEGGFIVKESVSGADLLPFLCAALTLFKFKVIGNKFDNK